MLQRVKELKNLGILDTEEEEIFNDIVRTATLICDAPISLITLLDEDRQWFKAKIGTEVKETPIGISICNSTINEKDGKMQIKDLTNDHRFCNNPFVTNDPNLKSYFGVSLETKSGERIGTVCVLDDKVRDFDEKQSECLLALAKFTMKLIEEKLSRRKIEQQNILLNTLNKNLESFTYMVAHDVKAPIRIINSFTELILKDKSNYLSSDSNQYFTYIQKASKELGMMITNLLDFSKKVQLDFSQFEMVNLNDLIEESIALFDFKREFLTYTIDEKIPAIFTSKIVLYQTIQNIISNSIKYRDLEKSKQILEINCLEENGSLELIFKDNGIGMSQERLDQIFDLFNDDDRVLYSTGIGLCVAKELLEKVGGKIELESELTVGTIIRIFIPKKLNEKQM